jgi:hypothetical protein
VTFGLSSLLILCLSNSVVHLDDVWKKERWKVKSREKGGRREMGN